MTSEREGMVTYRFCAVPYEVLRYRRLIEHELKGKEMKGKQVQGVKAATPRRVEQVQVTETGKERM
jgi:hypothetical protein